MNQALLLTIGRGLGLALATGVVAGGTDYLTGALLAHALVVGAVTVAGQITLQLGAAGAITTVAAARTPAPPAPPGSPGAPPA